jgi:mono/diheme cytochrome c family protein
MAKPTRSRQLQACLLLAAGLALPTGAAQANEPDLELGKQVFLEIAQPSCSICHGLADAGATGDIGPNLDELQPSEERVATAVGKGGDIMPAFGDTLSEEQIEAVAHYVATVAGRP